MENKKTDIEKVKEKVISRRVEAPEWDRLRFFIEIKEMAKFLEDVFKSTVPVVSGNVMEFFTEDDLRQFYHEIADLAILSSDVISKFDKLIGERQKEKQKELEAQGKEVFLKEDPITTGSPVGISYTDKPSYVI